MRQGVIDLGFGTEQPITSRREDVFGRGKFANSVAEGIATAGALEGALVIAIYGDWGSGKTSVANMVVESLLEKGWNENRILRFNPWHWRTAEEMTRHFFEEIELLISSY